MTLDPLRSDAEKLIEQMERHLRDRKLGGWPASLDLSYADGLMNACVPLLRALLGERQPPPVQAEWQPIESAPKDEFIDVLLYGTLGIGVGHWEPEHEADDAEGNPAKPVPAGWWGERGYWPCETDSLPTHWRPIPPPPVAPAQAEEK